VAGHTIPALAADLTRDPGLAAEFRTPFTEPRKRAVIEVLQRGVEAGHVHPGADLDLVEDMLVAPIVRRLVITRAPVSEKMALAMLDVVLSGVGQDGESPPGRKSRPAV
jgi:hypothetical protein